MVTEELYLLFGINFNYVLVFLGDHECSGVGRPQHVHKEIICEHIKLLHFITSDVCVACDAIPEIKLANFSNS
jgi:hypothetical protein